MKYKVFSVITNRSRRLRFVITENTLYIESVILYKSWSYMVHFLLQTTQKNNGLAVMLITAGVLLRTMNQKGVMKNNPSDKTIQP